MPSVPTMSLKASPMEFAAFTPTQYTPQVADPTLLARSLTMQEARQKEARQNLDAIDTALSGIRSNLNVAEHDWFDNKTNEIRAEIDKQIELGNWQSAIRVAQESARDIKRDTELQDKLAVNQLYNQERERMRSMGLDSYTQGYWDYRNKYSFNGTADWKPTWTPVKDISLANLQSLAVQMTAEDVKSVSRAGSTTGQTLLDSEGNVTTDLSQAVGVQTESTTGFSRSHTTHTKSKEDIEKTFRALLADSNVNTALGQKFDVSKWAYEDADARSKDMSLSETDREFAAEEARRLKSELVDENGILITDYDRWIEKKVIPMFKNTEYYNTADSKENRSSIGYGSALFSKNINRLANEDARVAEAEEVETEGIPAKVEHIHEDTDYKASDFSQYFNTKPFGTI